MKPQQKPPSSLLAETHDRGKATRSLESNNHQEPRCYPVLRFSPTAWAKLLFFRDRGHTEIGGFGLSAPDDLLRVDDFLTVRQDVTSASVAFDDEAVADFFDQQVDLGRRPEQFARIWLHTHPGESPVPSSVDEETFQRVFGRSDWAVMFVLGRTGKTYARLRFNVGPGGQLAIPVEVDYVDPFGPSDRDTWDAEYKANVHPALHSWGSETFQDDTDDIFGAELVDAWDAENWMAALEDLDPDERRAVLGELATRPDLWHEAEEVSPW